MMNDEIEKEYSLGVGEAGLLVSFYLQFQYINEMSVFNLFRCIYLFFLFTRVHHVLSYYGVSYSVEF